MSEQDGMQASKSNNKQVHVLQRPANDDQEPWKIYWQAQGQLWRTEPEICAERQDYLTERLKRVPDIEQGVYPFKGEKLNRADIEWLLATHENGRGPIDWSDESQRRRQGVDLRGADLRRANLRGLPMACLCAGLPWYKRNFQTSEQLDQAGVCLERADLRKTQLEGATLRGAHLEHANLSGASLEEADLSRAYLGGANLREANLKRSKFIATHLEGADLPDANLQDAKLIRAHLEGTHLRGAHLEGTDLRRAFFDIATNLDGTLISSTKGVSILLAGIHWGGVDLTMLNWEQVKILGDEYLVRKEILNGKGRKEKNTLLVEYEEAVRANRQLAVALQAQGLNEVAANFSYRAQKLQRVVLRLQRKFGQYFFSLFLDFLAGYGYKPLRSFVAYLLVITVFATAYFFIGHTIGPSLSPVGAWVFSMTSFHGRGFFPGGIKLDDPLTILAALEAFVGLLIEVTFIATLTRRLFSN